MLNRFETIILHVHKYITVATLKIAACTCHHISVQVTYLNKLAFQNGRVPLWQLCEVIPELFKQVLWWALHYTLEFKSSE